MNNALTKFTSYSARAKASKYAVFFIVLGTSFFWSPLAQAVQVNANVICAKGNGDQQSFSIGWNNSDQFFEGKGYIPSLFCTGGYAQGYNFYISDDLTDSTFGYYNGVAPTPTVSPSPEPVPSSSPSPVESPTAEVSPQPTVSETPTSTVSPEPSPSPSPVEPESNTATTTPSPEPSETATQTTDTSTVLNQDSYTSLSESSTVVTEPILPETPVTVPEVPSTPPAVQPEPTPEPVAQPQPEPIAPEPVEELPVEEPTVEEPLPVEEPSPPVEEEEQPLPPVESEPEVLPEPKPEPLPEPILEPETTSPPDVAPKPPVVVASDVDLTTLAPDTPVQLGNGVILTAEVAIAVALLQDPAAMLQELFTNPAAALAAFGSVGADLPPEVREKAEDILVSAIIAGGIATQAAANAAATAAYRRKP